MDELEFQNQTRPVWSEVSLSRIKFNFQQLRRRLEQKLARDIKMMSVVKADAYGHGAVQTARALIEAGSERLAVALPEEGAELREAGIDKAIHVLGETLSSQYELIFAYDLIPSVCRKETLINLNQLGRKKNIRKKIHIKVDTGMGRIGITPDDKGVDFVQKAVKLDFLEVEGIFSHLAAADGENKEYSYQQCELFNNFILRLEDKGIIIPVKHIANSAAAIDLPEFGLDMVRPGIALYGLYPSVNVDHSLKLKPVLSWKSRIVYLKELPPGQSVSYGSTYVTSSKRKVATIPVGYADGYPRHLSNKGRVLIRGEFAPIRGRICMDQFMVDVTDIDGVKEGDEVVLIGSQDSKGISADELAEMTGTINYEIVCSISSRVDRFYI